MEAEPLAVDDVIARIVADAAEAVSCRPGDSEQMQNDRVQTATTAIMTFQPRDAVEAMIVSRCVMFHEVLVDSLARLGRGDKTVSRSNIIATDKAIGNNLQQLERYRSAQTIPEPEPETIVPADNPAQSGDSDTEEAWPTAAQMAGFNRETRRAFDRKLRKHINKTARATERVVTSIHNEAATTASATSAG
jgi:hypothetical protein